jgi:diguanylate cyclase (GGDEF)-like protein
MTQEFLNVLFVGLAINGLINVALIVVPAVRGLDRRAAARRHAAAVAASGIERPSLDQLEAGRPWFPETAGHAGNGRVADPAGSDVASVAAADLATPESWRTWLAEESARAARYRHPTTIVVVELSGIDRLADRVGAAAANRLVPPVVDTLRRHARASDRLARLGPSRFGVLLVETDEIQAIHYVERIRAACDLWLAAGAVALRLSIGWAGIEGNRTGEAAYLEAERRMFAERRGYEPGAAVEPGDGRDRRTPTLQTSGA